MFTHHYTFTALVTGTKQRLLYTPATDETSAAPARVLLTAEPAIVADLMRCLRHFGASRYTLLDRWVDAHPGERCELRRAAGQILADQADPSTVAAGPLAALAPLLDCADQLSAPARNAVRQLILSMLDGADDIAVRVQAAPEHLEDTATFYANTWLHRHATDEAIAGALAGDLDVLYDDLRWVLTEEHPVLDEWMAESWVDLAINTADLTAWVNAHRPHLNEQHQP